jgi:integrase
MKATELVTKHLASIGVDPNALLFADLDRKHWNEHKLNTEWRKIRAIAGFNGRFHSLRTFSATEFAKRNPTDRELMERFGHRDIKTAMRYQRTTGREADLLRGIS